MEDVSWTAEQARPGKVIPRPPITSEVIGDLGNTHIYTWIILFNKYEYIHIHILIIEIIYINITYIIVYIYYPYLCMIHICIH